MDGGQYNYFHFGIRKIVKGKKTMQIFQICTTEKWRNYKTVWFFSRWINKAGAYKLVASAAGDSKKDRVVTNCALRKQQRSDLSLSHSLACLGNHVWPMKPPVHHRALSHWWFKEGPQLAPLMPTDKSPGQRCEIPQPGRGELAENYSAHAGHIYYIYV